MVRVCCVPYTIQYRTYSTYRKVNLSYQLGKGQVRRLLIESLTPLYLQPWYFLCLLCTMKYRYRTYRTVRYIYLHIERSGQEAVKRTSHPASTFSHGTCLLCTMQYRTYRTVRYIFLHIEKSGHEAVKRTSHPASTFSHGTSLLCIVPCNTIPTIQYIYLRS
jgi:hypothetical protein